jgi:kumamolisin
MSRSNVVFTLFFRERQRSLNALADRARRVCDPSDALYGRYASRAWIARMTAPRAEAIAACREWFQRKGLHFSTTAHPQIGRADGTLSDVRRVFGDSCAAALRRGEMTDHRDPWSLPDRVAIHLKSICATRVHSGTLARAVKGMDGAPDGSTAPQGPPTAATAGMRPADIRAVYDIPAEWTGKGETIALLNIGGRVDPDDLNAFWTRQDVVRSAPVTVVNGSPLPRGAFLERLEPTMGVEWIGAMAPDARIVVYEVDYRAVSDPWSAFLAAAVAPGDAPAPTVLVSTWSLPERVYVARHGHDVFAKLLEQVACAGVTFVAASGDWGAYDGRPSIRVEDRQVADAPWPHGVFPSVHDYVLSVGGTMITELEPLTELGWSGPLPPNEELRLAMPFMRLASSGGFSEDVSVPWWQEATLRPRGVPRHFRRGLNLPAVVPSGRGYPDVALMAQGAAVARSAGDDLSSVGYEAILDGKRINWAGGTSLAAPIWAAVIACLNQARRAHGLPRVGFVNPLLYQLAAERHPQRPFRPVTVGDSDVELRVLNEQGLPTRYLLQGYSSSREWNPVTGLGVPNVRTLIAAALRHGRRRRKR